MPYLFKPWITRHIDASGKQVPKGTPGARVVKERADKWYVGGVTGWPRGKRAPLATHRKTAEALMNHMEQEAVLGAHGAGDRFKDHLARPLAEHLDGYRRKLESKGDGARHVAHTLGRLRAVAAGCGFATAADLSADAALEWLAEQRLGKAVPALPAGHDTFTPAEVAALLSVTVDAVRVQVRRHRLDAAGNGKARRLPRATAERLCELAARGSGVQTSNHYVTALRGFGRWLAKEKRVPEDPFATLSKARVVTGRRARREFTPGELAAILAAAAASPATVRGLTGRDRFHLYLTAARTGFRAAELASLTPDSFALVGPNPDITVAAAYTKDKKRVVQPIPSAVAATLAEYLAGKPAGQPVWPGTWADVAADVLREDLDAAGVPYVVRGADGPLYGDFHALRHTFISAVVRSGVSAKQAQKLARHSTVELTIGRYSHAGQEELAGAVGRLPAIGGGDVIDAPAVGAGDAESSGLTPTEILAAVGLALASWLLTPADPSCSIVAATADTPQDSSGRRETAGKGRRSARRVGKA